MVSDTVLDSKEYSVHTTKVSVMSTTVWNQAEDGEHWKIFEMVSELFLGYFVVLIFQIYIQSKPKVQLWTSHNQFCAVKMCTIIG